MSKGVIFSVERYAVHDGSGIRTIVYFKGCPLRCLWCANPEGQAERSQVFFFAERCIGCGRCVEVCPAGASRRRAVDGAIEHDPASCLGCGRCVEECCADARRLFGRSLSVEEVMAVALKDRAFYRRSAGGVTLSGGEPTAQADFAVALLQECHRQGLHTALETCGHTAWPRLAAVAEHLDLALYDVKHMDSGEHRRLTGVPNDLILGNLRRLGELGLPMVVRVPVVPGCNDSVANLTALADFAATLPSLQRVDLLPYHAYGLPKYARLGLDYGLVGLEPPAGPALAQATALFAARGIACRVE